MPHVSSSDDDIDADQRPLTRARRYKGSASDFKPDSDPNSDSDSSSDTESQSSTDAEAAAPPPRPSHHRTILIFGGIALLAVVLAVGGFAIEQHFKTSATSISTRAATPSTTSATAASNMAPSATTVNDNNGNGGAASPTIDIGTTSQLTQGTGSASDLPESDTLWGTLSTETSSATSALAGTTALVFTGAQLSSVGTASRSGQRTSVDSASGAKSSSSLGSATSIRLPLETTGGAGTSFSTPTTGVSTSSSLQGAQASHASPSSLATTSLSNSFSTSSALPIKSTTTNPPPATTRPASTSHTSSSPPSSALISTTTHTSTPTSTTHAPTTAVATSATAATAAPSTSNTASGGISCKKGAGYNAASFTDNLKLCWAYNWASKAGGSLPSGVQYIPMLWGTDGVSTWSADAKAGIQGGSKYLFAFNEPDVSAQANMDPTAAASLYSSAMQPFATSAKLISPAVSNGVATAAGAPMGVPWLKDFLAQCAGCQVDAVALHWYDVATNTAYFTEYFTNAAAELNKPIWVTEFMGTGTPAEQATFLEFVIPWLESQTFIEAYAAFGDFADNAIANFVDSSGNLIALGTTYADTP